MGNVRWRLLGVTAGAALVLVALLREPWATHRERPRALTTKEIDPFAADGQAGVGTGDGRETPPQAAQDREDDAAKDQDASQPSGEARVEITFDNVGAAWEGGAVIIAVVPVRGGSTCREVVPIAHPTYLTTPTGRCHVIVHDERNRPLTDETAHQIVELSDGVVVRCRLPDGSRVVGAVTTAHGEPYVGGVALGDIHHCVTTDERGQYDAGFVPMGRAAVMLVTGTGIVHVGHVEVPRGAQMYVPVVVRGTARFHGWVVADEEGEVTELSVYAEEKLAPAATMWVRAGVIGVGYLSPGVYVLKGEGVSEMRFVLQADRDVDIGNVAVRKKTEK
jgi:hypothetical protein